MVKWLIVCSALALSACGSNPAKIACETQIVEVPIVAKIDIPQATRPVLRLPVLSETASRDDVARAMKADLVDIITYVEVIEAQLEVARRGLAGN